MEEIKISLRDENGIYKELELKPKDFFYVGRYELEAQAHFNEGDSYATSSLLIKLWPKTVEDNRLFNYAEVIFFNNKKPLRITKLEGKLTIYLDNHILPSIIHMLESNRQLVVSYWGRSEKETVGSLHYK